jgi:diguanylate cyclase (GGDEF)-like protein
MQNRRKALRTRALLAGKILLNSRRSVIDCVVRNLSDQGACLQVASVVGIPATFDLQIDDEKASRPCTTIWHAQNRIGVEFRSRDAQPSEAEPQPVVSTVPDQEPMLEHTATPEVVRGELLSLRAALSEVPLGIVLLDSELRAQFINRAFRKMWRLPDGKADSKPAFVSLMYHGRDTRAYDVPENELKAYIAERVALVRVGDPTPMDVRLKSGEVLRFQCTPLPNGGRMLSYTYVTDIVRHADELEAVKTALDNVEQGITLLDADLTVQFMNRAARKMWKVPDHYADRKPNYAQLVNTARITNASGVPAKELDRYIAERITAVRNGDPTPTDLRLGDGRTMRLQCAVLPGGGRMLTYSDVTDLIRTAAELQHFATVDGMTQLYNRRHFLTLAEAEWQRFQRYCRPLSLLMLDIDHFKFINDNLGHDAGDRAIAHLAGLAREAKRPSDILARLGGDEFALLLPETDAKQAGVVAERLRDKVARSPLDEGRAHVKITISIGVADATLSMPYIQALIKTADEALYRAKFLGRNRVSIAMPTPRATDKLAAE